MKSMIKADLNVILLDNRIVWFVPKGISGLYYFNLDTEETECFCLIPEDNKDFLFSKIIRYEDKIVLVPQMAEALYKIDIKDKRIEKIQLDISADMQAKFCAAECIEDSLYLLGANYPAIKKINLNSGAISTIECEELFPQERDEVVYVRDVAVIEDKLIIAHAYMNSIVLWDIRTDEIIEKKVINEARGGFNGIEVYENKIYLLSREENKIFVLDDSLNIVKTYTIEAEINRSHMFSKSVFYNGAIWAFPWEEKKVWKISCDSNSLKVFSEKTGSVFAVSANENNLCYFDSINRRLIIIQGKSEKKVLIKIEEPLKIREEKTEKIRERVHKNRVLIEQESDLFYFVQMLKNDK